MLTIRCSGWVIHLLPFSQTLTIFEWDVAYWLRMLCLHGRKRESGEVEIPLCLLKSPFYWVSCVNARERWCGLKGWVVVDLLHYIVVPWQLEGHVGECMGLLPTRSCCIPKVARTGPAFPSWGITPNTLGGRTIRIFPSGRYWLSRGLFCLYWRRTAPRLSLTDEVVVRFSSVK